MDWQMHGNRRREAKVLEDPLFRQRRVSGTRVAAPSVEEGLEDYYDEPVEKETSDAKLP